ncbi:MAG TPA: prolyl oligopeptidase family serine peptidase [Terriglobales bacterium]|nr:prolyl oligopeptidase family serine peptidase [Terriglobales bacterium]
MSRKNSAVFTGVFLLACTVCGFGRVQTGFLDRAVSVDGTAYRYQVYVPVDFATQKKWPVILFLHGSGERGSDGLVQTDIGIGHAIRSRRGKAPFVVVMPQCGENKNWNNPDMQAQALAALDASIKEFHGDRNRIYLTGLSMGGFGTWDIAAKYPGRFAALVPICGGLRISGEAKAQPDAADPYAEVAKRVGKTPVWIFHGEADQSVPVEQSRRMAEALKAAGANYKYTEYPGVGHNSWDQAYAELELVPWLLAQSLKK